MKKDKSVLLKEEKILLLKREIRKVLYEDYLDRGYDLRNFKGDIILTHVLNYSEIRCGSKVISKFELSEEGDVCMLPRLTQDHFLDVRSFSSRGDYLESLFDRVFDLMRSPSDMIILPPENNHSLNIDEENKDFRCLIELENLIERI